MRFEEFLVLGITYLGNLDMYTILSKLADSYKISWLALQNTWEQMVKHWKVVKIVKYEEVC